MFSFTNKKVMGVLSSEVKCVKLMERPEVIQNATAKIWADIIKTNKSDINH